MSLGDYHNPVTFSSENQRVRKRIKEENPDVRFDLSGDQRISCNHTDTSNELVQELGILIFGLFLIPGNCIGSYALITRIKNRHEVNLCIPRDLWIESHHDSDL